MSLTVGSLPEQIQWRALVGPGVIRNKDQSLQKTFRLHGPDLSGQSPEVKGARMLQANNAVRTMRGGSVISIDAIRLSIPESIYPPAVFSHPVPQRIDDERRANYHAPGKHFLSDYYMTFRSPAPSTTSDRLSTLFTVGSSPMTETSDGEMIQRFLTEAKHLAGLLGGSKALVPLTDAETMTYLHSLVSSKRQRRKVPDIPMYLNYQLTDDDLQCGYDLKLGDVWLQIVSITDLPDRSFAGLLEGLNDLGFEFRWSTRYIALPKPKARSIMRQVQGQYVGQQLGFLSRLSAQLWGSSSSIRDNDALNKSNAVDRARQEIGADLTGFGHFTDLILVWDRDPNRATEKAAIIEELVRDHECGVSRDGANLEEAFYGSLAGDVTHNTIKLMESSLNRVHTWPGMTEVWRGPEWNIHLDCPPLIYATTASSTPINLVPHVDDNADFLVLGPIGKGKTTFLNMIAAAWTKTPNWRFVALDFKRGLRCQTLCMGGMYIDLGTATRLLQPLRRLETRQQIEKARQWIRDRLREAWGRHHLGSDELAYVDSGLMDLQKLHPDARTLTAMVEIWRVISRDTERSPVTVGSHESRQAVLRDRLDMGLRIRQVFEPWLGGLLDGNTGLSVDARWIVFEWESFMKTPDQISATLSHLWDELEDTFTGQPTLFLCDELNRLAQNELIVKRLDSGIRLWRYRNVGFGAATQAAEDITNQAALGSVLIQNCFTRYLLPNPAAMSTKCLPAYEALDLTEQQIQMVRQMRAKEEYLYQRQADSQRAHDAHSQWDARVFRLRLDGTALAVCGRNSPADQLRMDAVLEEYGLEDFWKGWFKECGIDEDAPGSQSPAHRPLALVG